MLLKLGVSPTIENNDGKTALEIAQEIPEDADADTRKRLEELVVMLEEQADRLQELQAKSEFTHGGKDCEKKLSLLAELQLL